MRALAAVVLLIFAGCVAGTDGLEGFGDSGVVIRRDASPPAPDAGFPDGGFVLDAVAPPDSGPPIECSRVPRVSLAGVEAFQADFSPDGAWFLYRTNQRLVVARTSNLSEQVFETGGIGWAAFTANAKLVVSTRDSGGGDLFLIDPLAGTRDLLAQNSCLSWMTPDRRFLLSFADCEAANGAGPMVRGELTIRRVDRPTPLPLGTPIVRFDSVRLSLDQNRVLFASENGGCGCDMTATDVVEINLTNEVTTIHHTFQGRGILGHTPALQPITSVQDSCVCPLRAPYGVVQGIGSLVGLGSGTPTMGADVHRSLDGRTISDWAFRSPSVGRRGIVLYADAFGARPFIPAALKFFAFNGSPPRDLTIDVAFEPEPGKPLPFALTGRDDEVLIFFDFDGDLVRMESDVPGVPHAVLTPPNTYAHTFVLSPDREKIALFAESAGQVPLGALVVGPVDGNLEPLTTFEPFIEIYGFLPQSDGLLIRRRDILELIRFDGRPSSTIDTLPLGPMIPVVDSSGCSVAYQVNGAFPELRIAPTR